MKVNMSNLDRGIRIIISLAIIALIQQQVVSGVFAIVLVAAVIVIITTTIFGICPLYSLLNISTSKKKRISQ
jgi:hypothetical protein